MKIIIKNFNKILKTVPAVIEVYSFPPKIFKTDLKRIIATASFTIPSPKTIENSLGYFWGLIIVRAATESVAQIVAENKRITVVPSYMTSLVLVFIIKPKLSREFYLLIG